MDFTDLLMGMRHQYPSDHHNAHLKWLAQGLEDVAAELRQFIEAEHAIVGQRHVARQPCRPTPLFVKAVLYMTVHWPGIASLLPRDLGDVFTRWPPINPTSEIVWCAARNGRVITNAVRPPIRPAI
jgi:hypothetical protein